MARKGRTRWWQPTNEVPSPRLIRRVRGTILLLWAALLFVGVPRFVSQATGILQVQPPGPSRNAALRDLGAEAVIVLVAVPFVVLGVFGYGVLPRRNAAITGGPLFDVAWRPSKRRGKSNGPADRPMPNKPLQPPSDQRERANSKRQ